MRSHEPMVEDGGEAEEMHVLSLRALLHELVRNKGRVEAARLLRLDPRTVASCMEGGRMSWRVREALERARRQGVGSVTPRTRPRSETLEQRVEVLEKQVSRGLPDLHGQLAALRTERAHAPRTAREDAFPDGPAQEEVPGSPRKYEPGPETQTRYRPRQVPSPGPDGHTTTGATEPERHPSVVTGDPAPDDAEVYGPAWPLIEEWRKLREGNTVSGASLSCLEAEVRIRELEVTMLEEHGLTLPPETEPLRGLWRRSQLNWRREALHDLRRVRTRRELLRWVRRILTLGLLWK